MKKIKLRIRNGCWYADVNIGYEKWLGPVSGVPVNLAIASAISEYVWRLTHVGLVHYDGDTLSRSG